MKFKIDETCLIDCFKDIVSVPGPVGYSVKLTSVLEAYAAKVGKTVTDANAAVRAGNNIRATAFGMAVYCSHGMERTHISGL